MCCTHARPCTILDRHSVVFVLVYRAHGHREAEASQETQIRRSPSLSCNRGRFAGFASTSIPRAARASTAALAAPSDDFFDRPRVLRSAPKACALMTARVPQIGGGPGEGERLVRETVLVRVREREE